MNPGKLIVRIGSLIVITALAVTVWLQRNAIQKLDTEIQALRAQTADIETLRAEASRAKEVQVATDELERLRANQTELLKLRGEVSTLRREVQAAANRPAKSLPAAGGDKTLEQLQSELRQAQSEIFNYRSYAMRGQVAPADPKDICVNTLRQLGGAKAQWALENKKTNQSTVNLEDIAVYLPLGIARACPAGGTYSLSTVSADPACSIPGHSIQTQR